MPRRRRALVPILLFGSAALALLSGTVTVEPLPAQASHPSVALQPSAGYAVLYRFQGGKDGMYPNGLVADKFGSLYGTTQLGGGAVACPSTGCGILLKLTPAGGTYSESVLHRFTGGADGAYPAAAMTLGKNGVLYGTTSQGGGGPACSNGCGTVFKMTPTERGYAERILYRFQGGSDGAYPVAPLIVDQSGALYGTTSEGGRRCKAGCGTAFRLTPSGPGYVESVLYRFRGHGDGAFPSSALMADRSGALYGTAPDGGIYNCRIGCGMAFKLTPTRSGYAENILYGFRGGKDGANPSGALIADKVGVLYGTTSGGGYGAGIVFSLRPLGSQYAKNVLHDFKSGVDGQYPTGGVVAAQGALYGTTFRGGSFGWGTVFKVTSKGHEVVRYAFQGYDDGALPAAGLIVGNDGALYGATSGGGGACHCGTVFKLTP
jgi:uncharacterized repeat protein (TIGR03803 family)